MAGKILKSSQKDLNLQCTRLICDERRICATIYMHRERLELSILTAMVSKTIVYAIPPPMHAWNKVYWRDWVLTSWPLSLLWLPAPNSIRGCRGSGQITHTLLFPTGRIRTDDHPPSMRWTTNLRHPISIGVNSTHHCLGALSTELLLVVINNTLGPPG